MSPKLIHEFSNIIGAIMGNAEVAIMELKPDDPARESIQEVLKASKRARELLRSLSEK